VARREIFAVQLRLLGALLFHLRFVFVDDRYPDVGKFLMRLNMNEMHLEFLFDVFHIRGFVAGLRAELDFVLREVGAAATAAAAAPFKAEHLRDLRNIILQEYNHATDEEMRRDARTNRDDAYEPYVGI
jgi:hypothetical protein